MYECGTKLSHWRALEPNNYVYLVRFSRAPRTLPVVHTLGIWTQICKCMYKSFNLKIEVGREKEINIRRALETFMCWWLHLNFNDYIQISCSSWGFLSLWWPSGCRGTCLSPRKRDRSRHALWWGWNMDCREPRLVQVNVLTFDTRWFICRLLMFTSISLSPEYVPICLQATYTWDDPHL